MGAQFSWKRGPRDRGLRGVAVFARDGFPPRVALWALTIAFTSLFIYGLFVPVAGVVTGVDRVVTPWGEQISMLRRESLSPMLVPVYLAALSVSAIGLIGGFRLWARDRVGGVLTIVTSLGYFLSMVTAFTIDTRQLSLPYLGPLVTALWVLPIAWQVARANQRQAEQLVATERRSAPSSTRRSNSSACWTSRARCSRRIRRRWPLPAFVRGRIGKPFWETQWWTHSPALQMGCGRRSVPRRAARRRFEVTHPGRDNRLHYVDFSLKPVYDAGGAVVLLIPEGHDITERKEAEDALRRSEERFRLLVQNQTEFVVSCQPDATLTFVNDSYCEYFDIRAEDGIGSNLVECFAPKDRETMAVLITGADPGQAGGQRGVSRDGQERTSSDGRIGPPSASSMPTVSSRRFS